MNFDIYTRSLMQLRIRKTVGSYRFVSKIRTKMAHLIQRMYSFLFISKRRRGGGRETSPGLGLSESVCRSRPGLDGHLRACRGGQAHSHG